MWRSTLDRLTHIRPVWILVGLILLAAALRLWRLDVLPPGLAFDEAYNGLDARRVLSGIERPLWFPGNSGREPLFIYLQALSVAVLGTTPYALRVVSALVGIVTVPAIFFCAYAILRPLPATRATDRTTSWLALVAAAGIVVSYWHLSVSRLGFRAGLLVPTSALAIAFFWRAWTAGRTRDAIWAGVWLALAMYTYTAARILPLVILLFTASELGIDLWHHRGRQGGLWQSWQGHLRVLAILGVVGCLGVLPLVWTFWSNPALLSARTADVSIWSAVGPDLRESPVRRLLANSVAVARGFYDRGDRRLRHNLPGRPANDLLQAALFTVGWLSALWQIEHARSRLLLIWFGVMLAPTVLSMQAPHFLRSAGALPPLVIFYAVGAETITKLARRLTAQRFGTERSHALGFAAILVTLLSMLLVSGSWTTFDYFRRWARSPELGDVFDVRFQLAAQEAANQLEHAETAAILMSPLLYFQPQMGFAVGRVSASERVPAQLPGTTAPARMLVDGVFDPEASAIALWYEGDQLVSTWLEPIGTQDELPIEPVEWARWPLHRPGWPQLGVLALPESWAWQLRQVRYPMDVIFENGLHLVGYDIQPDTLEPSSTEDPFRLTLFWLGGAGDPARPGSMEMLDNSGFDVFAHLNAGGAVVQTANGPLGRVDLASWLHAGQPMVEDVRLLPLPAEAPTGKAHFETGLYDYEPARDPGDYDRIAVIDELGRATSGHIELGAVTIGTSPPAADLGGLQTLGSEFDGRIQLVGWRAVPDPANTGTLSVDLGWRALDRSSTDYTAFVHLIDDQGQILSQHDQPPGGPDNPTHLWVPGETLRTTFVLTLPSGINLDALRLRIGLYEPVGGRQLPVAGTREQPEVVQGETFVVVPAHTP